MFDHKTKRMFAPRRFHLHACIIKMNGKPQPCIFFFFYEHLDDGNQPVWVARPLRVDTPQQKTCFPCEPSMSIVSFSDVKLVRHADYRSWGVGYFLGTTPNAEYRIQFSASHPITPATIPLLARVPKRTSS